MKENKYEKNNLLDMQCIWKDNIRIIFDFDGYIDRKFEVENKKDNKSNRNKIQVNVGNSRRGRPMINSISFSI